MPGSTRPYKAQKRTYLQGTILKLFDHHCGNNDLSAAAYIRGLIREDLTNRYEMKGTGIVKVKR